MMEDRRLFQAVMGILVVLYSHCQNIGDDCPDGKPGVCVGFYNCSSAIRALKRGKPPRICFFVKSDPIICCNEPRLQIQSRGHMKMVSGAATSTVRNEPAVTYTPEKSQECPQIEQMYRNTTAPSTSVGRKAFEKCVYYQEKYVYPCLDSSLPGRRKTRGNFCMWQSEGLIVNGENAASGEFPHMVLLGFVDKTISWKCGGTILSERFVLTAAHCTKTGSLPVSKIKIGILKRSDPDSNDNLYNVLKIHIAEGYRSPEKYNDIALLETDRDMLLNPLAFPACLHDGAPVSNPVIATGWGVTNRDKHKSDILQKVFLRKVEHSQCYEYYKYYPNRNLRNNVINETQVCYGDAKRDTCFGDSGGPVQIRHPEVYCMYLVLGVTSFGRSCGIGGPGVYTRVAHYLRWIESIVWP